jgi:hypothetical protein
VGGLASWQLPSEGGAEILKPLSPEVLQLNASLGLLSVKLRFGAAACCCASY